MSSENNQQFHFDKFVRDLEERENRQRQNQEVKRKQEAEWYARQLQRKYREHPLHQITAGE